MAISRGFQVLKWLDKLVLPLIPQSPSVTLPSHHNFGTYQGLPSMANPTQELTPEAKYGRMPFDIFLLERWDYAADATQDKRQWDSLARQYLAMKPKERHPYHMEARQRLSSNYVPPDDNIVIARILPSFQSIQERNYCGRSTTHNSHDPVIVRTHYSDINDQTRNEAYTTMVQDAILQGLIDDNGYWNDKALYNYGADWQCVLLRAPELCDQERHAHEELYHKSRFDELNRNTPPIGDREELDRWLWDWSSNIATRLYIADREAIDDYKIKVFYLDVHGNAVWHHKFNANTLLEYDGAWHGMGLAQLHGAFSGAAENGSELII
ncbi:hypothetical protein F5Y04DRAFT_245767 [Hypomontagnella monticulosa]|nr:hypothetical protein F5Y04DRAFT_245767 [Hypomontagnella monticulosa]